MTPVFRKMAMVTRFVEVKMLDDFIFGNHRPMLITR